MAVNDALLPGFEYEEGLYAPPVDAGRLGGRFPITIGRRSTNDLVLHHASVSGQHARLVREVEDGVVRYAIEDMGSTNGTRVEGERVRYRHLGNGELVHLGDVGLRFGQLPVNWWDEARLDYLASALPWPLALPFHRVQTADDVAARAAALYRLCEEMTRLVAAAGSAVAAANGGADAALRWALTRLRDPTPADWVGATGAVVRAGSDRGWLAHLPGLAESAAGATAGTEGAWDALTQWVRSTGNVTGEWAFHEQEAALEILQPGVTELLLAWTFLHEGRLIWTVPEDERGFQCTIHVAHGARPATTLDEVRIHGQLPGARVPYWILSAAGGAACLAPWYRVGPDPSVPVVSWEGCPDDLTPSYRSADTGAVASFPADEVGQIPMGVAGTYQWSGFRDYLGADRSAGAVVDLKTSPEVWARILGVAAEGRSTESFEIPGPTTLL